jgi:protein-disulfide isomerase
LSASEYSVVTLGDSSSGVNVDVFLDLVCIDTKKAWPVIKQVIQTYDRAVQWRFHQFPLPYHTNAFIGKKF